MVDPSTGRVDTASSRSARLEHLALRYRQPLVRYFKRKGFAAALAEDCTQEVFVRLARTNDETVQNAEAYLFTIASSVVATSARKAKSRREAQHHPIEDFLLISGEVPLDRVIDGKEALLRLAAALSELPVDTREMFLLNREDGLSYTQIAARYAVGVKVVERHIIRALNHLRERVPRHD
jgi:RNA polymerase sigma factor (sigma-70 family)